MTLELSKVTSQVTQLGEQAAQRKRELDALTPQVREILRAHRDDDQLIELAQRADRDQTLARRHPDRRTARSARSIRRRIRRDCPSSPEMDRRSILIRTASRCIT